MIDAQDLALIRSSVTKVLEATVPAAVPAALLEQGWDDLLTADVADVVPATAEAQGRCRAASPVLDLVALAAAGLPLTADVAVVLPAPERADAHSATTTDGVVQVDGILLAGHERAEVLAVLAADGVRFVAKAGLDVVAVAGAAPELALARVTGTAPAEAATPTDAAAVTSVVAAGRRFLASELLGLADAMLAEARDYVLVRQQFGHPIGAFQAVKHRLADVHVAITAGRAGVATAWSDQSPTSAVAAKCLAGRAHALAATHCHQVQGGIAFTEEHGFHRSIARGHVLDALLGSSRDLTRDLGSQILGEAAMPRTPQVR